MQIHHVTIESDGRRPLFPDENRLRKAVRVLIRIIGAEVVLFNIVDDHLHNVLACDRERAGRFSQRLGHALASIAVEDLQPGG